MKEARVDARKTLNTVSTVYRVLAEYIHAKPVR